MVFSSLSFLIVFLPILIISYFIIPAEYHHIRPYVLLLFSLIFYGSSEPLYIFLIISCILISWILSRFVKQHIKWALYLSILINVIPLIITKYFGFILSNACNLFHITNISIPNITMPIGISFYTFQVITYIVDLYHGNVKYQKNPLLFALYIMFFPQLIAGPIVKYSEVAEELKNPDVNWDNVKYGIGRFVIGLGKKVLIANQVGYIANAIQNNALGSLTPSMTWLCVISFTIQIYFDFSGYSDMAIGLGAMLGFHFPENFRNPYTSISVSDFWRRWHITLSRFFKEYIYIPLGGNKVNTKRWILNIFIVWGLTGLWHGASWNFIIWGLYYGILIVIEKKTGIDQKLPKAILWLITSFIVIIGWGIFMCDSYSLQQTVIFISKLFFISGEFSNPVTIGSLKLWGYIPFLIIGIFISTPLWVSIIKNKITSIIKFTNNTIIDIIGDIYIIAILIISLVILIGSTYNPFIYFRF